MQLRGTFITPIHISFSTSNKIANACFSHNRILEINLTTLCSIPGPSKCDAATSCNLLRWSKIYHIEVIITETNLVIS